MSKDVYAKPDLKKKVRKRDRDRGQRGDTEDSEWEDRVVDIYQSVDDGCVSGPQEDMRDTAGRHTQGQRSKTDRSPFRVVAGCLVMCLILLGVIIGQAVHFKSCPSGWKKFGDSCYYRSTAVATWQQSRQACLNQGADLVVINSAEEQEFIRGLKNPLSYSWMGLTRTHQEGKWAWLDGTPLTTQYWFLGYPYDDEDKNCAAYWHWTDPGTPTWYNDFCSATLASICEKI